MIGEAANTVTYNARRQSAAKQKYPQQVCDAEWIITNKNTNRNSAGLRMTYDNCIGIRTHHHHSICNEHTLKVLLYTITEKYILAPFCILRSFFFTVLSCKVLTRFFYVVLPSRVINDWLINFCLEELAGYLQNTN